MDVVQMLQDLPLPYLDGGGGNDPSPGFSSIAPKPSNQSLPKFVTLIIII